MELCEVSDKTAQSHEERIKFFTAVFASLQMIMQSGHSDSGVCPAQDQVRIVVQMLKALWTVHFAYTEGDDL